MNIEEMLFNGVNEMKCLNQRKGTKKYAAWDTREKAEDWIKRMGLSTKTHKVGSMMYSDDYIIAIYHPNFEHAETCRGLEYNEAIFVQLTKK